MWALGETEAIIWFIISSWHDLFLLDLLCNRIFSTTSQYIKYTCQRLRVDIPYISDLCLGIYTRHNKHFSKMYFIIVPFSLSDNNLCPHTFCVSFHIIGPLRVHRTSDIRNSHRYSISSMIFTSGLYSSDVHPFWSNTGVLSYRFSCQKKNTTQVSGCPLSSHLDIVLIHREEERLFAIHWKVSPSQVLSPIHFLNNKIVSQWRSNNNPVNGRSYTFLSSGFQWIFEIKIHESKWWTLWFQVCSYFWSVHHVPWWNVCWRTEYTRRSEQSSVPFVLFRWLFKFFELSIFPTFYTRLTCNVQVWSVRCTYSRYSEGKELTRRIGALPTLGQPSSCWRFTRTWPKTTVNRSCESNETSKWRQRVDAGISFTFVSPCTSTALLLPEAVYFSLDNTSTRTSLLLVPFMNQTLSQSS